MYKKFLNIVFFLGCVYSLQAQENKENNASITTQAKLTQDASSEKPLGSSQNEEGITQSTFGTVQEVFLLGGFKEPGAKEFSKHLTLKQALALGGGFVPRATRKIRFYPRWL